jgi:hypothetical protein
MFSAWHITVTALVTAVLVSGAALLAQRRERSVVDALVVGVAAGIGVLLWRLGANTPTLNADSLPGVSPADVFSAPLAYVAVGVAAALRESGATLRLTQAQGLAALIALIVNIVTI